MIMRKTIKVILLTITMFSCARTQNIDELKRNYIFDDLGLYIEKTLPTDNNSDRYTIDNKIYAINRIFVFDYYIVRKGDTLKIKTTQVTSASPEDFQRSWEFVAKNKIHENRIETISFTVLNGISNDNQTMLKYEYQCPLDPGYKTFYSTSGVIENEMNTWMHPHRDKYFMILELNPFPYIQKPFRIGNKWTWTLEIGDYWQDDRWKTWSGSIKNNYEYEIIGKQKLKTKIGEMQCWIVQGTAVSEIGATGLIGYFNEEKGFVKLDYVNIDKSKLIVEIKEIKEAGH